MLTIKKVTWLSEESQEAIVEITDGEFYLVCFSQPCRFMKGQKLNIIIGALGVENVTKASERVYAAEKLAGEFDYYLIGRLINNNKRIVAIGNFLIQIDGFIPGDIQNDEFISFQCERLDL